MTQNGKQQSLNLKDKMEDKKIFVLYDNQINMNFMTRENEFYDQLYR